MGLGLRLRLMLTLTAVALFPIAVVSYVIVRDEGRNVTRNIDFEVLAAFPRWSPGEWKLPEQLVAVAVQGLRALAHGSGGGAIAREPEPSNA